MFANSARLRSGTGAQSRTKSSRSLGLAICAAFLLVSAQGSELVTLRNGFEMVCDHREVSGGTTRLYTTPGDANFLAVSTSAIASIDDTVPAPTLAQAPASIASTTDSRVPEKLSAPELRELLTAAGAARNLDVDLLACVVHAESNGRVHAVSRSGAQGLMQLMPRTAAQLGVNNSFRPEENVHGGTAYLDSLLLRYHDNLALALAAYNAGPNAVDRYHGVPPYRETRAYVARIIHEFNQMKRSEERAAASLVTARTVDPVSSVPRGANN